MQSFDGGATPSHDFLEGTVELLIVVDPGMASSGLEGQCGPSKPHWSPLVSGTACGGKVWMDVGRYSKYQVPEGMRRNVLLRPLSSTG